MDADRLLHYIKNPAHLYQVSYTELKSLVLQYPYCQNLRYLLLKKSILENHKEQEQNLQLAATYSCDRQYLYHQIKDKDSFNSEVDSFVLKEDYIELKSISTLPSADEPDASLPDSNAEPVILGSDNANIMEESEVFPVNTEGIEKEDTISEEKQAEDNSTLVESAPVTPEYELNTIEEEEIEDITSEFDDLFLDIPLFLEASNAVTDSEQPTPPPAPEPEVTDEAISIEDLIKLDRLTPLQRMEKKQEKKKSNSDKTKALKQDFDISDLDALMEETKKEIQSSEKKTKKKGNKSKKKVNPDPESHQEKPKSKSSTKTKSKFKNVFDKLPPPDLNADGETFILPEPKKSKKTKKQKKKSKPAKSPFPKLKRKQEIEEKDLEKPKKIADKSLRDSEDIASETLAKLLIEQGSYDRAIEMYEHLSLKFPEKSSFFAEQIENLKKI